MFNRLLRYVLTAQLAALFVSPAGGQPGVALRNPDQAIARDTIPPFDWRFEPIDHAVTLVVPWFGISAEVSATKWRTVFMIVDDGIDKGGQALLEIRYNPGQGAIELLLNDPSVVAQRTPTPTPGLEPRRVARVDGLALEENTHYCAVVSFDPLSRRMTLSALVQGVLSIAGHAVIEDVEQIDKSNAGGRLYLGNPFAGGTSHTGPIFPIAMRQGATPSATIDRIWRTPGGPRLYDLIVPTNVLAENFEFIIGATGNTQYLGPAETGQVYAWYQDDGERWDQLTRTRDVLVLENGVPVEDSQASVEVTPLYEPGMPWSGFWQPSPALGAHTIGLEAVAGQLPEFRGVLDGTRKADTSLTAWGLGNSRWANTTPVARSMSDSSPVSRSHLLGLRAARPQYDGGLVLLTVEAHERIEGIRLLEGSHFEIANNSNWSRFSYGSSFAASPGNGRPVHLNEGDMLMFSSDAPARPTQSLALVLERPRGGRLRNSMYIANANGVGGVVAGTPLEGSDVVVDTSTEHSVVQVTAVGESSCTVAGDLSQIRGFNVMVGESDETVNVIDHIVGNQITCRFPWINPPTVGESLAIGPVRYRVLGFEYDGPASVSSQRGLVLEHTGAGRITVCGIGLRDTDPNRICYVLAGRGGLGQSQQAEKEAPGTLAAMSDALGVGLYFTGLATQSEGTLDALAIQLGDRLNTREFVGTPDVLNGQGNSFGAQNSIVSHLELRTGAVTHTKWAYIPTQDKFLNLFDQHMSLMRHDSPHPNGRGMLAAAELWWDAVEAQREELLHTLPCRADVNGDSMLTPQDFSAWVTAYNAQNPLADQNGDGLIAPNDFSAWVINYQNGC